MFRDQDRTLSYEHYHSRGFHLYHLWPVCIVVCIISFIFIGVSLYEPNLLVRQVSIPLLNTMTFYTGAFSECAVATDMAGSKVYNECFDIDSSCNINIPTNFPGIPNFSGEIVSDCTRFNVVRGLMIASLVLIGLGLFCQILATCRFCIVSNASVAFLTTMLGALSGLVSMALLITLRESETTIPLNGSNYDYSFWLLVSGWVVAFIMAIFYIPFIAHKPVEGEPLLPSTLTSGM